VQRSTDRILTTIVGSLVRPPEIYELMKARANKWRVEEEQFAVALRRVVADVVARESEVGIDVVSDGEMSKPQFGGYLVERLDGLEAVAQPGITEYWQQPVPGSAGGEEFAEFWLQYRQHERMSWKPPTSSSDGVNVPVERFQLARPVRYVGHAQVQRDIDNFRRALGNVHVVEAFIPSITPVRMDADPRHLYADQADYMYALADALHEEYLAIVNARFLLQLDWGVLNTRFAAGPHSTPQDARRVAEQRVEIVNHALRDIPEERVRYHHCWGSQNAPHTWDAPLSDIVEPMLKIKAQAYSIEAANPRHEYEWRVWRDTPLPDGKILMPGVVTHSTNVVEHPETVAERIERFAGVVGRENVIASTDCGFSQGWYEPRVHSTVQWAKLRALVEGARLASHRLFD
jgi:5-methyltetrahydropteroyltriglutamate--homocysteine methyltransferase